VPTLDKARRIRETIAKALKCKRIRRFNTTHVLGIAQRPAV
jgi:hypothetical protein